MEPRRDVVCFQCGKPVLDPPVLNRLADGRNCPACADRVLDALPPIFHAPFGSVAEGSPEQAWGNPESSWGSTSWDDDDRPRPA